MREQSGQNMEHPLTWGIREIDRRVAALILEARALFYEVMLFLKPCPACGSLTLLMVKDGQATCSRCGCLCDPTVVFQTCSTCDTAIVRRMYHYFCPACRTPVRSHYCFDVKVFDAEYFRDRMAESRNRKREKVEKIKALLANSRSPVLKPDIDPPTAVPVEIAAALNSVLAQSMPALCDASSGPRCDLNAYRSHLLRRVTGCVVEFDGISPLIEDARADRAFRFMAAVFMENDGILEIADDGSGHLQLVGA
jgi:hypothetical protein